MLKLFNYATVLAVIAGYTYATYPPHPWWLQIPALIVTVAILAKLVVFNEDKTQQREALYFQRPDYYQLKKLCLGLAKLVKPDPAHDEDPRIRLVIGWDPETGDWGWQAGDNSFTAGESRYPLRAEVMVSARCDWRRIVERLYGQLNQQRAASIEQGVGDV